MSTIFFEIQHIVYCHQVREEKQSSYPYVDILGEDTGMGTLLGFT